MYKSLTYFRILKNVKQGIPFNHGTHLQSFKNYRSKTIYSSCDETKDMIHCLSRISYNLYKDDIKFEYNPPYMIYSGWCKQDKYDTNIWTIKHKNIELYKNSSIIMLPTKLRDTIPCIEFEINEKCTNL